MTNTYYLLVYILKYSIRNKPAPIKAGLCEKEWSDLFYLASKHDVQPLIMNSVYSCDEIRGYKKFYDEMMHNAQKAVIYQARRTADFLLLYKEMNTAGLRPLIVKGLICRNLYETPELRFSVDEDLFIAPDAICRYHDFLCKHGFVLADPDTNIHTAAEVSYRSLDTNLYLEVHKYLFPPQDPAYGDLNKLFSDLEEPVTLNIYDTDVQTLGFTDHFLYLITHALKHMIYSGIGIRQICDIALFGETYGMYIDWSKILSSCRQYHMETFLYAILTICWKYFDMDISCVAISLQEVDEKPLLHDILSGGTYGAADENRLHSATMTLRAVSSSQNGTHQNGILHSLFPNASYMKQNYSYLKDREWMLPIAWLQRICTYLINREKLTDPTKTIAIGNQRIELLKLYGIIGQ